MHTLDTTGWNEFPFSTQGHNFVSKIAPDSPFMSRIAMLPAGVFDSMNKSAVADCIGFGLTREQVLEKLASVNENASHAVIEIV